MIFRSKAPFRIGLAGGGSDVSPYSDLYGGAILNATISLYANASVIPREDGKIIFHTIDANKTHTFDSSEKLEIHDGLALQIGIYNRIVRDFSKKPLSFELFTSMDVKSGSGLGTSSTLVIAILGAFVEWLKLPLGEYDIAQLAYSIEREDLKMEGGKQDQYAATFGGINFMEFYQNNRVIVNPLRIKQEYKNELQTNLILYYTQTSRESSKIIKKQIEKAEDSLSDAIQSTHIVKEQSFLMKEAILKNELWKIGEILKTSWENKKKMADGISNDFIDNIYNTAIEAGAIGGKISGAGGGGFMIFYCQPTKRYDVISALEKMGGIVYPYQFVDDGLSTWSIK